MSTYNDYFQTKEYNIPSTMQAVIACGKGFENLQVAEVAVACL